MFVHCVCPFAEGFGPSKCVYVMSKDNTSKVMHALLPRSPKTKCYVQYDPHQNKCYDNNTNDNDSNDSNFPKEIVISTVIIIIAIVDITFT